MLPISAHPKSCAGLPQELLGPTTFDEASSKFQIDLPGQRISEGQKSEVGVQWRTLHDVPSGRMCGH